MTELTSRQILDAMDKALEDISRRFASDPEAAPSTWPTAPIAKKERSNIDTDGRPDAN